MARSMPQSNGTCSVEQHETQSGSRQQFENTDKVSQSPLSTHSPAPHPSPTRHFHKHAEKRRLSTGVFAAVSLAVAHSVGGGGMGDVQMLAVYAAIHGWHDVLRRQLRLGASLHCRDCYGFTPLYMAVTHGWVEMVRWLLRQRARTDVVCGVGTFSLRGDTALENILWRLRRGSDKRCEYYEIYKLLLSHGARRGARKAARIIRRRNAARVCALWKRVSDFAKMRHVALYWSERTASGLRPECMDWESEMESAFGPCVHSGPVHQSDAHKNTRPDALRPS